MKRFKNVESLFIEKYCKLILFISSIVLTSFTISWYKIPWGGDSTFTIASGMYMAGYDWSSFVTNYSYYGFGYSAILSPLMRIINDPIILYKCMLFFNCIIYSVTVIIIYNILHDFCNLTQSNAYFASISSIIWFPTFSQKDFVINETALLFWTILLTYLFLKLTYLDGISKKIYSGITAILLIYGYIIHSRSIIFIITVFLSIIYYRVYVKKWLVTIEIFLPLCVICLFLANAVSKCMQNALWSNSTSTELANTMSTVVGKVRFFSYFTSFDKILEFIKIFITNLLTYIYVTGGLFSFAMIIIIPVVACIKNKVYHNRNFYIILALLGFMSFLGMLATISLSYVGILEEGEYSYKYLFYTRYAAPYGCIIWILFFAYIFNHKIRLNMLIIGFGGIMAEYYWLNSFVSNCLDGLPYRFSKTMLFNIYRFVSDILHIQYLSEETFLICSKIMLLIGSVFLALLLVRKYRTSCVMFIILSFSLYYYYNSLIAESINIEYLMADKTIQYFKEDTRQSWSEYMIYFGGTGSYLCAVRYGLFDFDMTYIKDWDDEINISSGIYITNKIPESQIDIAYVIELDLNEYILTESEQIYNIITSELENDYRGG